MKFLPFYKKHEKEVLLVLVVLIWILCYFSINVYTEGRETHILALPFEDKIPFIPHFIIFYFSTYVLAIFPYFFVKNIIDYRNTVLAYLVIIFISSIVYLIYPVETIRPDFVADNIFLKMVATLYAIAKPYNLFPSMHVSLSTLATIACFRYNKRLGYFLIFWLVMIILSTLFVKQHYMVDLMAALVLAFLAYYVLFTKRILKFRLSN